MTYKSLGWDMTIPCTPVPSTFNDKRTCREKTGCTRECHPKKLKCQWCGEMNSSLNVLEEIETGNHISICMKCRESIKSNIMR